MRQSKLIVAALLLAVLASAGLALLLAVRTGRVDDWVGRQLVGIVNTHLEPSLGFETLELESPKLAVVNGATLTAPDGTEILSIDTLSVRLAKLPRVGEPIVIQAIEIVDATIHVERDPVTGRFKGLDPILKGAGNTSEPAEDDDEAIRLSDVFELRRILLDNVDLRYDAGDGSAPMVLPPLTADLTIVPETDDDGRVWHAMDLSAREADAVRLDARARLDLDTFTIDLKQGDFAIDLDANTMQSLPPELRTLLEAAEARGRLSIAASGLLPLTDPASGRAQVAIGLREFNVGQGEFQIPIESIDADARLDNQELTIELAGELLGGRIETVEVSLDLTTERTSAYAEWNIAGLDLEGLMRTQQAEGGDADEDESKPAGIAGLLSTSGSITCAAQALPATMAGEGTLTIRDGRLIMLPGLTELADLMGVVLRKKAKANHTFDMSFRLTERGIEIDKSELVTAMLAARATGAIGYSGEADLTINAGILERIQSLLGPIGDALANLTDELTPYILTGPITSPSVRVAPLGMGAEKDEAQADVEVPEEDSGG